MCNTGTIVMWGGRVDNVPDGWLVCDGSQVSQQQYKALYAVIGDNFGGNPNPGQFYLPDLRGRFIRGVDDGAGRDPDVNNRTDMQNPNSPSSSVGSVQDFAMQQHYHATMTPGSSSFGVSGGTDYQASSVAGPSFTGSAARYNEPDSPPCNSSAFETRPLNAYLFFIIMC